MIDLRHGDMRDVLPTMEAESVHSVVTDPPYHLTEIKTSAQSFGSQLANGRTPEQRIARSGFMNRAWDGGSIAFDPDTWRAVLRVLKPGGFLLSFGGTRTQHRMVCAIEDAGFEIRDVIAWIYGSGFPKSLDISKAIDRAAGAEREVVGPKVTGNGHIQNRKNGANSFGTFKIAQDGIDFETAPATAAARQWNGWGTALKPAMELICVARKPLSERTVAGNVLRHGTGGINVDACRIPASDGVPVYVRRGEPSNGIFGHGLNGSNRTGEITTKGRFPANLCHDGSPEVEAAFAAFGDARSAGDYPSDALSGGMFGARHQGPLYADTGTASRFFYSAKATSADRADSRHPTIKPIDLIRWLVKMVTPPNGTVLDPFAGSGTTGEAAMLEGFNAILIEREVEHHADIQHRQRRWHGGDLPLFAEAAE